MKWGLKHPLLVGAECEAADANGTWWKVQIVNDNGDATYRAEVDDGPKTIWESVSPDNMRISTQQQKELERLEEDLERAEKTKDEAGCLEIERQQEHILHGSVARYKKGDPVEVMHNIGDEWKAGTVASLDPIVVDTGYSMNQYAHIRHSASALQHPLSVGDSCEALDAQGTWWPVTVDSVLSATSYSVSVDDGAGTRWPEVNASNMRKRQTKKIERERSKEKKQTKKGKKKASSSSSSAESVKRKSSKKESKRKKGKKSMKKEAKEKKEKKGKSSRHRSHTDSDNSSADERDKKKKQTATTPHHHHHHHHSTTPVKGDVISFTHYHQQRMMHVTALVVSKTGCKLPNGEQVNIPSKCMKKNHNYCPLSEITKLGLHHSRKEHGAVEYDSASCVLSRDASGGSNRPSFSALSFEIHPDSPDCRFAFTLKQQCKLKKCDPPSKPHEFGPLSFGFIVIPPLPQQLQPQQQQQQEPQPFATFLSSASAPVCVDGFKDHFSQFYYFTTQKSSDDKEADNGQVIAAGSDAHMLGLPSLRVDQSLTVFISRSMGRITWVCGGEIREQSGLPRFGTIRPFVALSKGHSVTISGASQEVGRAYAPELNGLNQRLSIDPKLNGGSPMDRALWCQTLSKAVSVTVLFSYDPTLLVAIAAGVAAYTTVHPHEMASRQACCPVS